MPKGVYEHKRGYTRSARSRQKLITCEYCSKENSVQLSKPARFCNNICYRAFSIGKNHPSHKDGKVSTQGYRLCDNRLSHQRLTEHRAIAAKALGRPLKRNEVVHHINGDKLDNAHDNLLVCNVEYHQWLHMEMSRRYMHEHYGRHLEKTTNSDN